MATRAEIELIASNFSETSKINDDSTVANYTLPNGRSQNVVLTFSGEILAISSPFARIGQISHEEAVSSSEIFGVVELGDFFGIRTITFLENLSEEDFLQQLVLVGTIADKMEQALGGDEL